MNFIKENLLALLMIVAGAAVLLLGIVDSWLYGGLFEIGAIFETFGASFWMGLFLLARFLLFIAAVALVVLGVLYLVKVLDSKKLAKIMMAVALGIAGVMLLAILAMMNAWAMLIAVAIVAASAAVIVASK